MKIKENKKGINVLSLFDGICGAKLAIEKSNIKIKKYYSSEIDKNAIKVQNYHYGNDENFIQIGDIKNVNGYDYLNKEIDLIVFGSPCIDLSSIKKNKEGLDGKHSSLFFEALRIIKEIGVYQPFGKKLYFLMENVASMKNSEKDKITFELSNIDKDVQLIKIDSATLSGVHRRRYYWTNIPNITQPTPTNDKYQDVLENGFVDKDKANVILSSNVTLTSGLFRHYKMKIGNIIFKEKSFAELPTNEKLNQYPKILENSKYLGKSRGLSNEYEFLNNCYRTPSVLENERLMGFSDGYISEVETVSKSQKQKLIGQSFQVDTVSHILNYLPQYLK